MDPIPTVDFETEAIEPQPKYPPKPVGVSIWMPGDETPTYRSWGHPSENNSTFEEAQAALAAIWDGPIAFHHARFDTEVARVHMGLPVNPNPKDVHDTLFLNYLYDSHAPSLSLKPSAHRILNIAPDEQTELNSWLKERGFKPGADICKAPGGLVGKYANGDTYRTRLLFEKLYPIICDNGMLEAYQREQRLAPILSANEDEGIRIDLARLEQDLPKYIDARNECAKRIRDILGPINIDSSAELAKALIASGKCAKDDFLLTPKGALSVAKASIERALKDPELRSLLGYHSAMGTLLSTFFANWLNFGSTGRMHPQFNQVKGEEYGTRTGRLSSSNPNFQNIPNEFDKIKVPPGLPPLPKMRQYILPDEEHLIVSLDFNAQEMRIMAHFAEGRSAEIYRNNPDADFHGVVADLIRELSGMTLPHKMVKNTGFSLIYGSGVKALGGLLGVDYNTAYSIKHNYFQAVPDFEKLMEDIELRGRSGGAVRTWGGRRIFSEPPVVKANGQRFTFDYKLLNHLVQGSAADQTKEAIATCGYKTGSRRFLATVHDENVYSIHKHYLRENIREIASAMNDQPGWDVPFKAKVMVGVNWAEQVEYAQGS